MLSSEQVTLIRGHIDQSAIEIPTLKDDVLDHLCCLTETNMQQGLSFEKSFEVALLELAPSGLDEIQRQTTFLLNSKYTFMKKAITISGNLFATSMILACLFKFLHFPLLFSISFFVTGAVGFALCYLPMSVIDYFRSDLTWHLKLRYIFGLASIIVIGNGVIASLMLLPAGVEMIMFGLVIFILGFLPFFFVSILKRSISDQ